MKGNVWGDYRVYDFSSDWLVAGSVPGIMGHINF